jgi:AcrR family transcriptional regulator
MSDEKNTNQLSLVNDLSNKVQNIEFSKTQLEIIYAAEIIMGQKGIENTTHRDIVNLAGQKNTSAILYHFGSIEGVVNALFDIRMAVQNQERAILLEKVLNQKTYTNMDLMDAYIDPMFNKVFHDADWSNWIYFLQNLIISSNGNKYYADKYRKAAAEIEKLFAEKNDIQNDLMYSSRVSYNAFFFISAIASRKRQTEDSENDFIQNAKRFNSLLNLPSKKDNYITSEHEFLKFLKTTSIFILTNKESKL